MNPIRLLLVSIFTLTIGWASAQNDTINKVEIEVTNSDTIQGSLSDSSLMKLHSPKKAAIFSAIIPGAGQVYNKKYWKVPVIYILGGGLVYLVSSNYNEYQRYRTTYIARVDSNSSHTDQFPFMSNAGVQSEMERYQKNYELAAVGVALVYILQVVDASVDAHLSSFNVSDDLSLRIRPTIQTSPYQIQRGIAPSFGLKLNLRFR